MAVISYKCPNCGGELTFRPDGQDFACGYCGTRYTAEAVGNLTPYTGAEPAAAPPLKTEAENDAQRAAAASFVENAVYYLCPSCGAEIMTDSTTAASFCYYCHNPVVLSGRLSGEWAPDKVVPFAFGEDAAKNRFREWCGKKWLIDKRFMSSSQLEKFSGIYFPHWVVDARMDARLSATSTAVRSWRVGDTEYTETNIYAHERAGEVDLSDLTYRALSRRDAYLTEGVYPYNLEKAENFEMTYLSGFGAERRNMEKTDVAPGARRDEESFTQQALRHTLSGAGVVTVTDFSAAPVGERWRYTLLPAWILTYDYAGKKYYFSMNGQTGKIFGAPPISKGRLAGLFAGVAAAVCAVLTLGGYFL